MGQCRGEDTYTAHNTPLLPHARDAASHCIVRFINLSAARQIYPGAKFDLGPLVRLHFLARKRFNAALFSGYHRIAEAFMFISVFVPRA